LSRPISVVMVTRIPCCSEVAAAELDQHRRLFLVSFVFSEEAPHFTFLGADPDQPGGRRGRDARLGHAERQTTDFVTACRARSITPHLAQNQNARRSAIDRRTTRHPGYAISQRIRKPIEAAFGWAKSVAGLHKLRYRGLPNLDWHFTLAMAAYDLVRLPKLLGQTVP
jgi:hypothetical protein